MGKQKSGTAVDHSADIQAHVTEEINYGSIIGPFDTNSIDQCHVSPFITWENSNSVNRRVIFYLSWPHNFFFRGVISKNSYENTDFTLAFPKVDQ